MPLSADQLLTMWDDSGKGGLWVYGERHTGTSTLCTEVAKATCTEHGYRGEGRKAQWMVQQIKDTWSKETLVRGNSNDYPLLEDLYRQQQMMTHLLEEADLLMIDDFYAQDLDFWKKHLLIHLDMAIKAGRRVIVCGSTTPSAFGNEWQRGIDGLYLVVPHGAR